MNKSDLTAHIAQRANITLAEASRAIKSMIEAVTTTLKKRQAVQICGFGTFKSQARSSRQGRNPRTGAAIKIKAHRAPKFTPGQALKNALK